MFTTDFGLGTLISNLSSGYGTGRWARNRMKKDELRYMDDEMMARVEASKAAGLHPLVGLGVSGLGSMPQLNSPAPYFRYQSEGKVDPDTQRLRKAQADHAELQVLEAKRRLATQPGNSGGGVFTESDEFGAPAPRLAQTGKYMIKPAEITSVSRSIPWRTAGPQGAGTTDYTFQNVWGEPSTISLPSKDVSEPLEGLGEVWKTILGFPMGAKAVYELLMSQAAKQWMRDMPGIEGLRAKEPARRRKGGFGSGSTFR